MQQSVFAAAHYHAASKQQAPSKVAARCVTQEGAHPNIAIAASM